MQPAVNTGTARTTTPPLPEEELGAVGGVEAAASGLGATALSLSNSGENPGTVAPKKGAILVLGENLDQGAVLRVLTENMTREAKDPKKESYDLLFISDTTQKFVSNVIKSKVEVASTETEATFSDFNMDKIKLVNSELKWSEYSKLYVLADDGISGSGLINSGKTFFNPEDLVDKLETIGALKHVKDIRITSGGSGDKESPSEISKALGESISTVFGSSIVGAAASAVTGLLVGKFDNGSPSFAEKVKTKLDEKGHSDVAVTGYRGKPHFELIKNSQHTRLMDDNSTKRRSEVRVRFTVKDAASEDVD